MTINTHGGDVEMLAGIQGAERDTHAKAGCGAETDDEKDDRQFSAMVVVQEINSPGKQEGGCRQGEGHAAKDAQGSAVDIAGFFMILASKRVSHVGEDRTGKAQIQEAVIADERHRNGPDAVLLCSQLVDREGHDEEADDGHGDHAEHTAARALGELLEGVMFAIF